MKKEVLDLCKQTYNEIISIKSDYTNEEINFISELHQYIHGYVEKDFKKIIDDITKLSTYTIRIKS